MCGDPSRVGGGGKNGRTFPRTARIASLSRIRQHVVAYPPLDSTTPARSQKRARFSSTEYPQMSLIPFAPQLHNFLTGYFKLFLFCPAPRSPPFSRRFASSRLLVTPYLHIPPHLAYYASPYQRSPSFSAPTAPISCERRILASSTPAHRLCLHHPVLQYPDFILLLVIRIRRSIYVYLGL
jgi:hypothetical protein